MVKVHSVKSVQMRSFFWSVFPYIRNEYRKMRTKKTRYLDTFHAVVVLVDKLLDCDEWICFPKNSSRGNKKRHFSNYHSNGCEEGK